ncbi:180_t:CDS:2, partial [Racocetra persica]
DGIYDNKTIATLYEPWEFYAEFIPEWYKFVVDINMDNIKSGPNSYASTSSYINAPSSY